MGTLTPAKVGAVVLEGGFWGRRLAVNRQATIPAIYQQCRATGRIDAFRLNWRAGRPKRPHPFWDSDVAKWLEAACYSLIMHPDRRLRRQVDRVAEMIAGAQQTDGYLNSYFTSAEPDRRWTNLRDMHELYCAGHLMEAAVAHHEATGGKVLLEALCRYADHITSVFGRGRGKRRGYPGHEEIELALVKLYRATGRREHLGLAKYFIDERGRRPHYFDTEARARGDDPATYRHSGHEVQQAHQSVREQREAVGHAVRALYLYAGMADVAVETEDRSLLAACRQLWRDVTRRKMYVTGGAGSSLLYEGFTGRYDLPNDVAYAETCAAIALVFFSHRMLQVEGDGQYADVMERALYNAVASGVSLAGTRFFYANPLSWVAGSAGRLSAHHAGTRQPWFGTACCPTNVARLLASLGRYVYSVDDRGIHVHLYAGGSLQAECGGAAVTLTQRTDYPWDGRVELRIQSDRSATWTLRLRIPGWCRRWSLTLNGRPIHAAVRRGYALIRHRWSQDDAVRLDLAMPVERIAAHPSVAADVGRVALQRGPLVYCLEQCDHVGQEVHTVALPASVKLTVRRRPHLLGGVVTVEGRGVAADPNQWRGVLYAALPHVTGCGVSLRAVPYCVWANRKPGAMSVWMLRA